MKALTVRPAAGLLRVVWIIQTPEPGRAVVYVGQRIEIPRVALLRDVT